MYSILNILFSNKANSQLYALTQVDIMEAMETDGEKWSDRTIYNKIKELRKKGFVSTGLRQSEGYKSEYLHLLSDMKRGV